MHELAKAYTPADHEDAIYQSWMNSGFFNPEKCIEAGVTTAHATPFSIVLPPPNVTGTLHMGHATMLAVEDAIVRFHRMKGDRTLWVPGTDHAAIATQSKVEKLLMENEKKSRFDLGREEFLKRVDAFAQASHDTIVGQAKKMGSSLDWSREAFTLDESRNRAVRVAFKKMYDEGLIYRGFRVVNWDPKGHTTVSDDEVEHKEVKATLYTFRYSKDFPIPIATTRPETKVGDTAVAVHPKGKWKKFIGKTFEGISFAGATLNIRVVGDDSVDREFGTGALGVTPAHSAIDADIAGRNELPMVQVIGEDGRMTAAAGSLIAGLTTVEARAKAVEWLRGEGLLEGEVETIQNLSVAERSGGVIEPLPKLQWFIAVNKEFARHGKKVTLKKLMQDAVKKHGIEILPPQFQKTYFHWVDNLRDWCISRQIWYGHQVPVWYRGEEIFVGVESPEGEGWIQDPDTLDTWFSSGLWTFSTLGWPTTRVFFVRHGQADNNVKKIMDHSLDGSHLSELGKKQVAATAKKIKKLIKKTGATAIISSPVARCRETADILAKELGLTVYTDDRLREVFAGEFEGRPIAEWEAARGGFSNWMRHDTSGMESYAEVKARLSALVRDTIKYQQGKTVIIVSHGDPIAVAAGLDQGETYPKTGGYIECLFDSEGKKNNDLAMYHPTSVLETGYDILFFWVARMILMTTYLLDEVPFKTVYLHGLVRDEQGRKMSKSLGNIIDPLDMIAKYGTDATRLSLLIGISPGNDMKLSEEKIAGFRNFTNKLWNIGRFVISGGAQGLEITTQEFDSLSWEDQWILGRLSEVVADVTQCFESYELGRIGEVLREFTWNEFADWYLEIAKIKGEKTRVLYTVFSNVLKLWHPFMPFVTEELWALMHGVEQSEARNMLMVAPWPTFALASLPSAQQKFEVVREAITAIRTLRADHKLPVAQEVDVAIGAGTWTGFLNDEKALLALAGKLGVIQIEEKVVHGGGVAHIGDALEVHMKFEVDPAQEKARLQKELDEVTPYVERLEAKLANEQFVKGAPAAVVEQERAKLAAAKEKKEKLESQLR